MQPETHDQIPETPPVTPVNPVTPVAPAPPQVIQQPTGWRSWLEKLRPLISVDSSADPVKQAVVLALRIVGIFAALLVLVFIVTIVLSLTK